MQEQISVDKEKKFDAKRVFWMFGIGLFLVVETLCLIIIFWFPLRPLSGTFGALASLVAGLVTIPILVVSSALYLKSWPKIISVTVVALLIYLSFFLFLLFPLIKNN